MKKESMWVELKFGNIGDFVEIVKKNVGRIGDAIWLQIGGGEWNSREEQLNRCLVGRWEKGEGCHTDATIMRKWGKF